MIKSIDGLSLPPSVKSTPRLTNRDTQKKTASGRLITKLDTSEKWVVPIAFDADILSIELQTAFYAKCLSMRTTAATVVFISPYDGTEKTITAKCVSRVAPSVFNLSHRLPQFYNKVGAEFWEV